MSDEPKEDPYEEGTEFVMKKDGNHVVMWAVVNGHEVFHAAPPVASAGKVITAAVTTWMTRAWERELTDMLEEEKPDDGWFR